MMQIHVDAITASRIAETQYVLSKSLDMVRVSDKRKLLDYLKSGWDIAGKYHNGDNEENYKTTSESEIDRIKYVVENLSGIEIKPATTVTVSFTEYFERITCKPEKLVAEAIFFNFVGEKLEHENFRFEGDEAKKIRDVIVYILGMRQDKSAIITLLEKQLKKESEEQ